MSKESVKKQAAQLANLYISHRPVIQKSLNVGFVLYVLSTTYRGLSAKPSTSSRDKGKGKAKAKEDESDAKKRPRVAVRDNNFFGLSGKELNPMLLGRCSLLPEAV